jgi:aminomethyltransferase
MEPIDDITEDLYKGPFHERQVALGGTFYEDLGNLWTRAFGDPVGEYWAVRRSVGLWDVSALVKWRFSGPDTLAALDRLTTRRMLAAAPGVIRYGAVLDGRGKMLDEGTACVLSREEAFFFGNDEREPFERHLREHTSDLEVEIENLTQTIPNIAIQGPDSFGVLSRLTGADLTSLAYFQVIPGRVKVAGVRGLLTRTGFTGELGYEFFIEDAENAVVVWDAIAAAGARPFGLDAVEMLRIECGLLIQEEDYFVTETDPYDVSLDPFIELEDHDFVGRDACVTAAKEPPRRLVTIALEGEKVPEHGSPVGRGGDPVGEVTSACLSPRFGVLALAVLDNIAADDGEAVEVGSNTGVVRSTPFDPGCRVRPRSAPWDSVRSG